mgnify:CR=1 FL=1
MATTVLIERLRSQIQALDCVTFNHSKRTVSSSFSEVDSWLPHGGLQPGSFVELIQDSEGTGAYTAALKLARSAAETKPAWAVLDSDGTFHAPVAETLGWDLQKLVVVRAPPNDSGWAFAHLLRSKDIGACFWVSRNMDNMLFRRLQLAAERGGGLGFVIRPAAALRKPCWGSLRIQVRATPSAAPSAAPSGKLWLRLLHARGQANAAGSEIEVAL